MSFARRLARREERAAKKAGPLGALMNSLPKPEEMKDLIHNVQVLHDAIQETQERMYQTIPYLINDVNSLIYQTERQKAVTTRLLHTVSEGPKFLLSGAPRNFTLSQLREFETQFQAEYDAMYAFVVLAERLNEAGVNE